MFRSFKSQAFFLLAFLKVAIAQESFDWSTVGSICSHITATLAQVPLNYSEPDGGTAAIAVIKLNATVEASQYGGPIFLNPGGPGASGISFALGVAPFLQPVFGNQFDIIGFDPRGVNNSTPKTSIFRTEEESSAWFAQDVTDLNSTKEALPEAWARYQVFGQLAQNRNDDNSLNFVSTDNVARDMLSMVEAFGEEKLQFYGASYGTALGALFSTMFPVRCLDMDGYFNNDMKFMVEDIDKAMQTFFDTCHSAGPQACAFYDSSPSQIEANLEAIYDSVRKQPIPYVSGDTFSIITYDVLRETILLALREQAHFPELAAGLKGLSTGNGTSIFQLINEMLAPPSEAGPTADDVLQLQSDMASINSTFAGTEGLQIMTYCSGWKIRPEGRFNGPVGGNTSFPLLIMSSTIAPCHTFCSAKKTSSAFPGSALLQQDSVGHTALFAAGSNCTLQHLAAYFANGTLPEEGTICPANIPPFGGVNNTTSGISPRSFPLPRLRH
ncbi:hypothetical protein K435DRAFT_776675 [Dendrothele bispora CBS 962.96]|uniref:Alpha/beta-hydrolase n=1 Tax=Dendrothele bispora (strain CBS 962.96) TaxID=1314807 RepID=A0A4S8MCE8_DENBC|nr:hypothetical protein K435DRAFT_776675 [Dendrothele bispora CBS 962.96]